MKRAIYAAVAAGLSAVPAYGGFTVTTAFTNLNGAFNSPYSKVTVNVINNGTGGTFGNGTNTFDGLDGVQIRAIVQTTTGASRRFRWVTGDYTGPNGEPDGEVDTLDIFNQTEVIVPLLVDTGGFLRAAGTSSLNTYTGLHPFPISTAGSPWFNGSNYFEAAVVQTGNNTVANTSPGYQAIKLIVDDGATVRLIGRLGGNDGPSVPFQLDVNGTYTNGAPYVELTTAYINATPGGNFSYSSQGIDPDNQNVTITTPNGIPSFASLVTTPGAPAEFTIENNRPLTALDAGVYPVTLRATDPNGAYTDTDVNIRIMVVPEPASLFVLGGIGYMALRRRL